MKNPLKTKYTTNTCVFDLSTRMLLPKKVAISEMLIGHLKTSTFNSQVYVKTFDMGLGSLVLLINPFSTLGIRELATLFAAAGAILYLLTSLLIK